MKTKDHLRELADAGTQVDLGACPIVARDKATIEAAAEWVERAALARLDALTKEKNDG